jgi:hypothetical protein
LMVGMGVKTDDFHVVTGLTALTLGLGLAAAAAAATGATNAGTNGADWTRSVVLAASDAVSMSIAVVGASASAGVSGRVAVGAGPGTANVGVAGINGSAAAGAHAVGAVEACAQIELDMGAKSECDTGAGAPHVGAVEKVLAGSVGEGESERSVAMAAPKSRGELGAEVRCADNSVAHSVASRDSRGEVPVLVRGDEPAEVVWAETS